MTRPTVHASTLPASSGQSFAGLLGGVRSILMVRLRQAVHNFADGLLFIPLVFVLGAVVVAQAMTAIDGRLDDAAIPTTLTTSVEGGRSILSAIAGGLISSVTLLLSLVLVAVQLASSQALTSNAAGLDGNRTQQIAIGLVLGTAVYCLLVLRETRTLSDGRVLAPHLSVLLAVTLGVLSLIAVLRSVDELTNSLRIGSVAQSITDETVDAIHKRADRLLLQRPGQQVAVPPTAEYAAPGPAEKALAIPAPRSGWVQQIDEDRLIGAAPDGSVVRLVAPVGAFVMKDSPLAWVAPVPVIRTPGPAVSIGPQAPTPSAMSAPCRQTSATESSSSPTSPCGPCPPGSTTRTPPTTSSSTSASSCSSSGSIRPSQVPVRSTTVP